MGKRTGIFAILLLAGLVEIASASAAEARCTRQGGFRLSSEGPWPMFLTVESGRRCRRQFWIRGNATFRQLLATVEPRNGRLDLIEGGRYAYTSNPGFRGKDSFTLRICGVTGATREACANLAHDVTVQ